MDINEETHKTCNTCRIFLPKTKFGIVSGEYRRADCNRCHRAIREAKKFDMDVHEYLSYSEGPCQFCGLMPASAYFHVKGEKPTARICQAHRLKFRQFDDLEKLVVIKEIMEKFPFWANFLKSNNLVLFKLE